MQTGHLLGQVAVVAAALVSALNAYQPGHWAKDRPLRGMPG